MAYKLSRTARNFLVGTHVLIAMAWFGGTISLLLLLVSTNNAANGEQLFYIVSSMHVIDDVLIKYPGLAVLVSGVMLSVWTPWGLLKYYWAVIKLVLTIVIILIGILFITDWFSVAVNIVDQFGFAAFFQNKDFQTTRSSLILIAIFNIAAMAIMTFISHFKPFGKIRG